MKIKLDALTVATATCPPGKKKLVLWDTQIPGYVMEVRSSGSATLSLKWTDEHGVQRQHKIGLRGDISADKARKIAQRLRSEVVLGNNPAVEKAEKKAVPTYAELAKQHLADAKTYQRSYTTTEMYMNNHIVPRWGKLRLSEIKGQDIALWLAQKREEGLAPATVEKIRVIFARSYELARRWKMAGSEINPVKDVPRIKFSNARERFLTTDEVKRLMEACEKSDNSQLKSIIGLLMLTGARRNELLHAKWSHIDLERKAWLIPTSKTGKHRYVPLSGAAVAIIEQLPKYKDCDWLLPNPDTKEPFVSIKHSWDTARTEAKLPGLRLHDLRHSAASAMINSGVDLYTVGRILGHADHKSTMRYSHLANDTLLAAVEAGAAKMNISQHIMASN